MCILKFDIFFLLIYNFSSNILNIQRDRIFLKPIILDTLNQINTIFIKI